MPRIHNELHAAINRARSQHDKDVGIEELEAAIESIDAAVGNKLTAEPPPFDGTADQALAEARTHIRNDDLGAVRIRLVQAIALGGPAPVEVDKDKPLDKMTKAELLAYAAAKGHDVSQSSNKAGLIETIQELDAEASTATV